MITLVSALGSISTVYPFKGYGGIERIVADLAHQLSVNHDVRVVGSQGTSVDGCEAVVGFSEYTSFTDKYDGTVIDFSHNKVYNYDKWSVPFWSDFMGRKPIFPTKAVRDSFNFDGPVIMPGVDLSPYVYTEEKEDYYLYLGRIAPYKGTETVLHIARQLPIRIVIAGHEGSMTPKGYASSFRDRCTDIGLEYLRQVSEEKKRELMQGARGLIFPPNWRLAYNVPGAIESFGITAVEAIASGTPVFTNRLPSGIREIIDGGFGDAYGINQWRNMLKYKRPKRDQWLDRIEYLDVQRYADDLIMRTGAQ